jgi:hypothetical protein
MNVPQIVSPILPAYRNLEDVAAEINAEHELAEGAVKRGIEHARRAGELLIVTKAFVGHGNFMAWVKEHCSFGHSTALRYMRVAANWQEVRSKFATVANLTLAQALDALVGDRGPDVQAGRADNHVLPGFEPPQAIEAAALRSLAQKRDPDYRCPCCGHEWSGDPRPAARRKALAA